MNKPPRLVALAALFALGVSCLWYLQRPAVAQEKDKEKPKGDAPAAAKWEYRIVVLGGRARGFGGGPGGGGGFGGRGGVKDEMTKTEEELNKLGDEGFEVAFVTAASESLSGFGAKGGDSPISPVVVYTLKRAKK